MYKGKILLLLFSATVAITEANDEEYVISKNRDIHPLLRDPHRDSNNIKGYLSKIKILWQRDVVGDIPSHSVPSSDESEEVDDTVSNSVDQQEGRHLNRVWHQDQGRKHNKTKKVGTKKSRPKRKPGNIFNLANNHKKNKNKGKKHSKPKHGKSSKSSSSSKSSKNSGKSSTSKTNKAMTTTTTTIPIPYDCDDKDPCTTDMRIDGMCVYTPVDCREDESCYPETGECLPDEELVPCVAVIDEDSYHQDNDNDWMEFRSIYSIVLSVSLVLLTLTLLKLWLYHLQQRLILTSKCITSLVTKAISHPTIGLHSVVSTSLDRQTLNTWVSLSMAQAAWGSQK